MAQQIPKLRESTAPSQPSLQDADEILKQIEEPIVESTDVDESSSDAEQVQRSDPDVCDECGGRVVQSKTDRHCSDCGLVADSTVIDRRGRRECGRTPSDATRCGGSGRTVMRHDRGLATEIGYAADLRKLSSKKRSQIYRLRRHQSQSRFDANDYRRTSAFTEIKRITASLGLPEYIAKQACVLFREAHEASLLEGRTHEWFASASVYAACRCASLVRTAEEVAKYSRCNASNIHLAYGHLNRTFGLGAAPVSPQEYIPRFASQLDLSHETRKHAERIAVRVHDLGEDTGRSPSGIAGACLLLAANERDEKLTQTATSDVAGVTPATVRKSKNYLSELDLDTEDSQRSGGTTSGAEQMFATDDDDGGMMTVRARSVTNTGSSSSPTAAQEERRRSEKPGHMAPIPDDWDRSRTLEPEPASEPESVSTPITVTVAPSDEGSSATNSQPTTDDGLTTDSTLRGDHATDASRDVVCSASRQQVQTKGRSTMDSPQLMTEEDTERSTDKTAQQSLDSLREVTEETPSGEETDAETSQTVEGDTAESATPSDPETGVESDPTSDADTDAATDGPVSEPEALDDSTDMDSLVDLHSKRRSRGDKPDTFRYWMRLPTSMDETEDYFEVGDYAQITFTDGYGSGVGAAATGETRPRETIDGVAGIYLRKVPSDVDGTEVASARKIREDDSGYLVTLPPRVVKQQAGLGIDGDAYSTNEARLLFEAIARDDGLMLVPVNYDDGSTYELPETPTDSEPIREVAWGESPSKTERDSDSPNRAPPDPNAAESLLDGDYAGLDTESLPKNVLPLVQQLKSGGTGRDATYGYAVYLRRALADTDTMFEAGDHVNVEFNSGRDTDEPVADDERSRYDDDFNPVVFLGRIAEDDDPSMAPNARKLQHQRSGVRVVIPKNVVTGIESLGIDETHYDSSENPLLFEVLLSSDVIMLDPIGYQDGTPYPIPKPPSREEIEQPSADSLGEGEYVEGTAIKTEIVRDAAKQTNLSADKLAHALVAVEERIDRKDLKEQDFFDTGYSPVFPPVVGDHELIDAAPVVDFIEPTVWSQTIIPAIADCFDDADLETLGQVLPRIHARQAKQVVYERDSIEHRRFNRDVSALATLNPDW